MTTSHISRRSRSTVFTAAVLGALALGAAACSSPGAAASPPSAGAASQGQQQYSGNGSASPKGTGQDSSASQFSVAFAECMRAHGIPRFPNPDGQPGQLGPNSGVNIMSPEFQAAVHGPCRSLAPAAWVDAGPQGGNLPGGNG